MLDIALARRLGEFQLDVTLQAAAGATLVVVGESGSGKSTLLRLLAGLEHPDRGHITIGGVRYFNDATALDVPAWERAVGFVPQDYALFPHLSVLENVAFGLRAQGVARATALKRAKQSLEQLGVASLVHGRPRELSGGQQQRVALARALVLEPALLLLDEPLSALDLRTQRSVRTELKSLLASLSCVTVYVTHTPQEALFFGESIAVLEVGKLVKLSSREEFLREPRSEYVAEFLKAEPW